MGKVPYREEYTERMCATIPNLSRNEIFEFEKARLFMAKRYKGITAILTDQNESKVILEICDAVAGLNLIWEDSMLITWSKWVQRIRSSIRAADHTTYMAEGSVELQAKIGGLVTTAVFGTARTLATKIILRTALIDRKMKRIETSTNKVCPIMVMQPQ